MPPWTVLFRNKSYLPAHRHIGSRLVPHGFKMCNMGVHININDRSSCMNAYVRQIRCQSRGGMYILADPYVYGSKILHMSRIKTCGPWCVVIFPVSRGNAEGKELIGYSWIRTRKPGWFVGSPAVARWRGVACAGERATQSVLQIHGFGIRDTRQGAAVEERREKEEKSAKRENHP
ncbi:uncharacterized protein CIMG_13181 [Coccidioides immitis RS]|uniref:uncharacterized protein n=1 Tax=Coccidioides immitis (strain RS) TaxID=246410 RepID=UPI00027D1C5F|nr:uncharacterized protein CIMG_13181 [Coccidioides immitis RS]EAS29922.3 hypothetical protein CIMG_13181 [Coccidioides immitis RS]